jgi:alpha-glucosidase
MTKKFFSFRNTILWLAFILPVTGYAQNISVYSPDKRLEVKFNVINGLATYEVFFKNKAIIRPSRVGFLINKQSLSEVLYAFGDSVSHINVPKTTDNTWKPLFGESSVIEDHYNQIEIPLIQLKSPTYVYYIIIKVYNEGIAFRYNFPEQEYLKQFTITDELTEFNFANDYNTWWIKDDGSYYEQIFQKTALSKVNKIYTPVTITGCDSLFLAIHQAALIDYAAMSLVRAENDPLSLKCDLSPWPDGSKVKTSAPRNTPWRYVLISDKLSDIVESRIILNLNDPCRYDDVSWIKPQKFNGIFWGMHTRRWTWKEGPLHGATTAHAKKYIDFAASHHIDAMLMEGWNKGWETWMAGDSSVQNYTKACDDLDMQQVVFYAKQKGVEIIGHHETGANIPMYESQMSNAFRYYSQLGIHSVKTGYAGTMIPRDWNRHGQQMVNHYQSVVDTATKYHIMIDSHEPIIPTGLCRTYPNWMTGEAVMGLEWCNFDPFPPSHLTTLTYTRSLAGPFDFTLGVVKLKGDSLQPWLRVNTTLANQLALYVVFYSPMQMVADLPEHLEHNKSLDFIEKVPVTWDESHLLQGRIGEYTLMARRKGNDWYLGGITNETCRTLNIPVNFLTAGKNYIAEVYSDTIGTDWYNTPEIIEAEKYSLGMHDTIKVAMAKGGGVAIRLTPVEATVNSNLPPIMRFNKQQKAKMTAFEAGIPYGFKIKIKHLAVGKKVTYDNAYSPNYTAGGDNALTDGVIGTQHYRDGNWQGLLGKDMIATVDMDKKTKIQAVTIHFLQYLKDWIFLPKEVIVSVSEDGKTFEKISSVLCETIPNDDRALIKDFTVTLTGKPVRYIKIEALNSGPIPSWHHAAGNESWLFCDEVIIK